MKQILVATLLILFGCPAFAQETENEQAVWKLEHSYWEYVKALDLVKYKSLWHPDFVGWPSVSATPATKDHITDWITSNTKLGRRVESFTLKPAASRATENVVVTHYWIIFGWTDKEGGGKPTTTRITHTWLQTPGGWQNHRRHVMSRADDEAAAVTWIEQDVAATPFLFSTAGQNEPTTR